MRERQKEKKNNTTTSIASMINHSKK